MGRHTHLVSAFVVGMLTSACADQPEPDRGADVATGLALMRAGLQQGHDGITRYEADESTGLGDVRAGLGMMTEGADFMHLGFDDMATTYVAGGRTIHGMGANSRCGTVDAVVGPIQSALSRMDEALGMLTDLDEGNDAAGDTQFHQGKSAMAAHLGNAVGVMECMSHP